MRFFFFCFLLLFLPYSVYAQEKVNYFSLTQSRSLWGLSGLYRIISPKVPPQFTFLLGSHAGYFKTNYTIDELMTLDQVFKSREVEQFFGDYGVSASLLKIKPGGFLGTEISIAGISASSSIYEFEPGKPETRRPFSDQVLGDVSSSLKVSYSLENEDAVFGLLLNTIMHSPAKKLGIEAVSLSPKLALMYDFSKSPLMKTDAKPYFEYFPVKTYLNFGYTFDGSKNLGFLKDEPLFPPYRKYTLWVRGADSVNFGLGLEGGGGTKGITRFFSMFLEWYFDRIVDTTEGKSRKFSENPHFLDLGLRVKPLDGVYVDIVGDFNISSRKDISGIEGTSIILSPAPLWKIVGSLTFIWSPSEILLRREAVKIPLGRVRGKVQDIETGSPVPDAIVSVVGLGLTNLATDVYSGEFETFPLSPGIYEFEVRKDGYETTRVTYRVEADEVTEATIKIKKIKVLGVLYGSVKDDKGVPIPARITFEGENFPPIITDVETGSFEVSLKPGDYRLRFESEGYRDKTVRVVVTPRTKVSVDVVLETLEKEKPVVIQELPKMEERQITRIFLEKLQGKIILAEKIIFEMGTAKILPISYSIIEELAEFLKRHPNLRIRIESHTDPIGTPEQELKLTEDRSSAVKEFLVSKGISANRLETKGYGSQRPVASNDTPEGRSRNRRVEFIVLE